MIIDAASPSFRLDRPNSQDVSLYHVIMAYFYLCFSNFESEARVSFIVALICFGAGNQTNNSTKSSKS